MALNRLSFVENPLPPNMEPIGVVSRELLHVKVAFFAFWLIWAGWLGLALGGGVFKGDKLRGVGGPYGFESTVIR